jgi:hypothetical protein
VIPRKEIAETVGQAQHPLADWDARQHVNEEAGGGLGHAPAPAARTETAILAGKGNQAFEGTLITPETSKAVRQHAAGQKVPELLLYELRQARAVGVISCAIQEALQVLLDDPVQHAAFDGARLIRDAPERHAGDIRPARSRDNAEREIRPRS